MIIFALKFERVLWIPQRSMIVDYPSFVFFNCKLHFIRIYQIFREKFFQILNEKWQKVPFSISSSHSNLKYLHYIDIVLNPKRELTLIIILILTTHKAKNVFHQKGFKIKRNFNFFKSIFRIEARKDIPHDFTFFSQENWWKNRKPKKEW